MMKAKLLKKKIMTQAGVTVAAIAVGAGIMMGSGMLADKALQRKAAAENARNTDSSKLTTMQTQIQQSGDAEKSFLAIAKEHESDDYSANSDMLKDMLRQAKDRYRFGDGFKLTLALEQPTDKPELTTLAYDVTVRTPIKLELDAMSDVHVLSFLDQFMRQSPGLLNITKLDLSRALEMDGNAVRQMRAGLTPMLVSAVIEFTWVGLKPKETTAEGSPSAEPGA